MAGRRRPAARVSPLTYLPGASADAPPLRVGGPPVYRLRRGRGSLVLRALVPTVVLLAARVYATAAKQTHVSADAGQWPHPAGAGAYTVGAGAGDAPPEDSSGSSCSVLDTLCLDKIDGGIGGGPGGIILEVFLFFWCFLALAIVCDDYLVASLETLCVRWEIREDVAGSTFMAFGSAAPEIIVNAVATIKAGSAASDDGSGSGGSSSTDLGIAAIIGSGMIAFLLIPGICGFFGSGTDSDGAELPLQLKRRPLLRDVGTYSVGLLELSVFFSDGSIRLWEAIVMVCTYFCYVCLVITAPKCRRTYRVKYGLISQDAEGDEQLPGPGDVQEPEQAGDAGSDPDFEEWKKPLAMRRPNHRHLQSEKPVVVHDKQGRRIVFPAAGPPIDAKALRDAFDRAAAGGAAVTRKVLGHALRSDDGVRRLLSGAGLGDPEQWETCFDGAEKERVTAEVFADTLHQLARAAPPTYWTIDLQPQPPVKVARLVMSHSAPRIEIDSQPAILLPPEGAYYRALALVSAWCHDRPGIGCSLEWAEGSEVDGWFYSKFIPATVVRRHADDTYDVDWQDGSYSYKLPLADLAPRGIKQAHTVRPRGAGEVFGEHSKKLKDCLECGALSRKAYQDAMDELRVRVFGRQDGGDGQGSPRRLAGSPRQGRYLPPRVDLGAATPRGSEFSRFTGATALSVWRRRWWREDDDSVDYVDMPLWRWPLQAALDFFVGFWRFVFRWTVPDTALAEEGAEPNPLEHLYPVAFMISFLWVAVFSFVISTIAARWADLSGLGQGFIGLLLISCGAEIPDCIQSVTVAKRGYGSMAVSNAIGSQNVNIFIGLGLPWLMYNAGVGKPVQVDGHKSLQVAAFFQCGSICMNLFLLIGLAVITGENKAQLGKKKGLLLMPAYFVVLIGFALYDQLH